MKTFLFLSMFLSLTAFAQYNTNQLVSLVPGQSVLVSDYYTKQPLTVVCQSGGGSYVPPAPPVQPPPQVCRAHQVQNRISTVLSRAQRAASGYCVRDYGVKHCGDKLQGDPQLASTQERLREDLQSVKNSVNQVCRERTCSRYEEDDLVRDFNRTLMDIARLVHRNPDNGQYTRNLITDADVRNLKVDRCGW